MLGYDTQHSASPEHDGLCDSLLFAFLRKPEYNERDVYVLIRSFNPNKRTVASTQPFY